MSVSEKLRGGCGRRCEAVCGQRCRVHHPAVGRVAALARRSGFRIGSKRAVTRLSIIMAIVFVVGCLGNGDDPQGQDEPTNERRLPPIFQAIEVSPAPSHPAEVTLEEGDFTGRPGLEPLRAALEDARSERGAVVSNVSDDQQDEIEEYLRAETREETEYEGRLPPRYVEWRGDVYTVIFMISG